MPLDSKLAINSETCRSLPHAKFSVCYYLLMNVVLFINRRTNGPVKRSSDYWPGITTTIKTKSIAVKVSLKYLQ